jgi:hypothetical protein
MQTGIRDWGEAVMTSLAGALTLFLAAIPKLIGFLVIILVGWLVAGLIAKAVAAVLRTVKCNELAQRSGFAAFVHGLGVETDSAGFIAAVTKWFIRVIVLVAAFDALGLPAVSDVVRQLLLWLPNLVVALVVLVIGGLAAGAVASLVRGATARAALGDPALLARIARIAVWAFALVVAVNQIGIATTLVNTLFMATVGAVALALGLSFGLGGRETAAEIVRTWYHKSQAAAPKMQEAAQDLKERAQDTEQEEFVR